MAVEARTGGQRTVRLRNRVTASTVALMLARRLVLVVLALACGVPASAAAEGNDPEPRIVNGTPAAQGEYPAQGFLPIDTNGDSTFDSFCGGTLVGARQFLTAAHCATENGVELSPQSFQVRLGNVDRNNTSDTYSVIANDANDGYDPDTSEANDTAMLTLNRPAPYTPLRVVDLGEESLWDEGTPARIIGWGTTSSGATSSPTLLQEANVPIVSDNRCETAYFSFTPFDRQTMVCAADPQTTPPGEAHDTCQGDSGGPLMVPEASGAFVLVGVTSFGIGCADPNFPGVYAQLGSEPLNSWAHSRIPRASFTSSPASPRAGDSVTFTSTSTAPAGFTTFNWDLDGDGQFNDATGSSVSRAFGQGDHSVGLQAGNALGDNAVSRLTIAVGPSAASSSGGGTGGSGGAGGSTGDPGPDLTLPLVSSASLSTKVFAVNRSGPAERPVSSAKKGTTFRYRLSEPARVVFTIERALPGRRAGRRCAKPTSRNREKRKCTRYSRFGRFSHAGTAGSNSKRYSGRIGRKSMKPGRYRATLLARDLAGNRSKPRALKLRVVRR